MSATLLLDTLCRANLEHYYPCLSTQGVGDLNAFMNLTANDFTSLGVTSFEDRKKLIQLTQSLRKQKETSLPPKVPAKSTETPVGLGTSVGSGGFVSRIPGPGSTTKRSPIARSFTTPLARPAISSVAEKATPKAQISAHSQSQLQQAQQPELRRSRYSRGADSDTDSALDEQQSSTLRRMRPSDASIRRRSGLLDAYGLPVSAPTSAQSSNNSSTASLTNNGSGLNSSSSNIGSSTRLSGTVKRSGSELDQKIRVCVRKRPLSQKEMEKGEKDIAPTGGSRSITINEPKQKVDLTKYVEEHHFVFDEVFDVNESNEEVYARTASPLVRYIFRGGKATCFAYGQTGSGKTYTMLDNRNGLYVQAARDIFNLLKRPEYSHLCASIGFYEIYQGQLYDLLNKRKRLHAREDGKNNVVIVGLKEYTINDVHSLMQVFEFGNTVRSTGSTGANADSSRSHAILQILLRNKLKKRIEGKLSFIDLAGSERGADRGDADKQTRMEGAEINKSLLALKECIRALDQDKKHTPFRQSKLTQVLKDSFVGKSRTCMIATISPNSSNSEHTLNTLRYADRVKELKSEMDGRGNDGASADANSNLYDEILEEELEEGEEEYYDDGGEEEEGYEEDDLQEDGFDDDEGEDVVFHDDEYDDEDIFGEELPHHDLVDAEFPEVDWKVSSQESIAKMGDDYSGRRVGGLVGTRHVSSGTLSAKRLEKTPSPPLSSSPFSSPDRPQVRCTERGVDEIMRAHRAAIAEINVNSKSEAKLLANFQLVVSSKRDLGLGPEAYAAHFESYVEELTRLLEEKEAAIKLIKLKLKETVGR
ncbi:uncharacterized protein VTP21DRAFT_7896 [Calcarisporiella thermophila]|uniref:uncharacterized protein n=1 Tax=Calcarisporiella thermophila TaxID=911321 RepID=UPI003743153C